MLILLQQPFLANGHLSKHFEESEQIAGRRICVDAALAIWRLVESYKTTFTLRRAPYLISYAVYSAVVVILNQSLIERAQFINCVGFFWSALFDLQRGCNFGLQKPLAILREMMHQLSESILRPAEQQGKGSIGSRTIEKSGEQLKDSHDGYETGLRGNHAPLADFQPWNPFSTVDQGVLNTGAEVEDWPLNDALYGLFTPDPSFM